MKEALRVFVTAAMFLVWLVGLAGLPDDTRKWLIEWLPMLAEMSVTGYWIAALGGGAALFSMGYWWKQDGIARRAWSRIRLLFSEKARVDALVAEMMEMYDKHPPPPSGDRRLSLWEEGDDG